ncbi:MAG TPA: PAS domain-containing protein [Burkholderiales bacterium]
MNKAYLLSLTQEEVDALPFGLITLDLEGTVVGYNHTEAALSGLDPQRVLGRNFFEHIAPCTRVKEFAGLYREMVKSGQTHSWEFNFVFRFATGDKRVHIQLAYFPEQQRGLIMVQSPSDS